MKPIVLITLFIALFYSCNKVIIDAPTFNVGTDKLTYNTGDTVVFRFTGKADYIVFYSGEPGNVYANKDRVTLTGASNQLQFATSLSTGNQINNLSLVASTNFNGQYDSTNIRNATWVDVTNRAVLATSSTVKPSGIVDLSDFQNISNKPLFLAFRYTSTINTATSTGRPWTISNLQFNNVFPDGSIGNIAADIPTGSFTTVSLKNDSLKWSLSATALSFPIGKIGYADEDWAITKPLDLNKVSQDLGTPLKNSSSRLDSYNYVFNKPGTYKIIFVARNANIDNSQSLIKELSIIVTP